MNGEANEENVRMRVVVLKCECLWNSGERRRSSRNMVVAQHQRRGVDNALEGEW